MRSLAITWTVESHGWASVEVADDQDEARAFVWYVTDGPEQFLYAVTRLVLGGGDTRAEFEGDPQVYRWSFRRDVSEVDIRLVMADDHQAPADSGTLLWSGRHTITALARSTVRAFDRLAHELGEEAYATEWGRPFPRRELEALRAAMRAHVKGAASRVS